MKVMSRQEPSSSSLTVDPTRVPNCLRSTVGRAAAVDARRATAEVNFILMMGVIESIDESGWVSLTWKNEGVRSECYNDLC